MSAAQGISPELLREAFALFGWAGWTFDAAMADPLRSRIVAARAAALRAQRIRAEHAHSQTTVRRHDPRDGSWKTQRVQGPIDTTQKVIA
jgi:hypothetical protein